MPKDIQKTENRHWWKQNVDDQAKNWAGHDGYKEQIEAN